MKKNKHSKLQKKILYFCTIVLGAYLFIHFFNKTPQNLVQQHDQKQTKMGSLDALSKKDTDQNKNSINQKNQRVSSRNPASDNSLYNDQSSDEPTINLLEKFELDPKKDVRQVGFDRWFVSDKYSLVPRTRFRESMGRVIENTPQFVIAEIYNGQLQERFPPLVISHSTGNIVPLTGELIIRYQGDPLDTKKYLSTLKGSLVVDHSNLRSIRILQLSIKRKNEIFKFYDQIQKNIGRYNIEYVELEQRHLIRPI
jgi:hypothetical protein